MFIFLIGNVYAVGQAPAVDDNMVLYYKFNNDTSVGENYVSNGSVIFDYSNQKLNGTQWYANYSEESYLNDGYYNFSSSIYSEIRVSDNNILDFNDNINFSVSLWFVCFSKPTSNVYLIGKHGDGNSRSWDIRVEGNKGDILARVGSGSNNLTQIFIDTCDGLWHNVVAVMNRNSIKGFQLYFDGDKYGTPVNTLTFSHNLTNSYSLYIGRSFSGNYFNGSIDNFIIYNKSLSDSDVLSHFHTYSPCIYQNNGITIDVYSSTPLCKNTYYLNGSTSKGSLNFKKDNIVLDCNNSIIIGNNTLSYYGSYLDGYTNISIINCQIENYSRGFNVLNSQNISIFNSSIFNILNYSVFFASTNNSIINKTLFNNADNFITQNSGINNTFSNNLFYNSSSNPIYIYSSSKGSFNDIIKYNNFYDEGIYVYNSTNTSIIYNNFINMTNDDLRISYLIDTFNLNFSYNIIDSPVHSNRYGYFIYSGTNYTYISYNSYNNLSTNRTSGTVFSNSFNSGNTNIWIYNNNFNWMDMGLYLINISKFEIYNNNFTNIASGRDGYGSGIIAQNYDLAIKNGRIYNNNFTIGSLAVGLQGSSNVSVYNNSVNLISLSDLLNYPLRLLYSPRCVFMSTTVYRTWFGIGSQSGTDTITNTSRYVSDNINFSNNFFNENVDCYLNTQGTTNLSTDISKTWFVSQQFPTYLFPRDDFYLNPLFNVISTKFETNSLTDVLAQGYMYDHFAVYKINKNYTYYYYNSSSISPTSGIDEVPAMSSINLALFNLSFQVIYNQNLLIRTNTTDMSFNFTLSPNEELYSYNWTYFNTTISSTFTKPLLWWDNGTVPINYRDLDSITLVNLDIFDGNPNNVTNVLDNFNCSESLQTSTGNPCGRQNSPLSITQNTETVNSKIVHINSSLTDTINLTVQLQADCDRLGSVVYTSNTGTYNINYVKSTTWNNWFYQGETYTCSNGIVTLNNVPIEQATNSNEFELMYNEQALNACNQSVNAFISYIGLLGLIGTLSFLVLIIGYLFGFMDKEQLNKFSIITVVTTLILVGVLIIMSIVIVSTVCSVF